MRIVEAEDFIHCRYTNVDGSLKYSGDVPNNENLTFWVILFEATGKRKSVSKVRARRIYHLQESPHVYQCGYKIHTHHHSQRSFGVLVIPNVIENTPVLKCKYNS